MTHKKYIISGGGTGGHIFPAIAIANALLRREPNSKILFVGAIGKMEMEKVPQAGFEIIGLPISGYQRGSILKNLWLPFKLIYALFKAFFIIIKFKPQAAIGVGGYASGPLLFAAAVLRLPTVIQEQNAVAGLTNRILSRFVDVICVAYDELIEQYKGRKVVKTGNPVRKNIVQNQILRKDALTSFGFDETRKVIFVFGGSLGAATINKAVSDNLDEIIKSGWQLIWQTGNAHFDKYKHLENGISGVKILRFIDDMPSAYAAADITVARAGALSIAELQIVGKPTILVPSPNVTDDQQTKNVKALERKEATMFIQDNQISKDLMPALNSVLLNNELSQSLSRNIKSMSIADADEKIVDQILNLIK
jgi:UDP-N-acetylglucosamine--N-acetylmuramyl-(pentapeptide) pyrophosphoryl-undecaprenol N-acetylglucosamine transferase